MLILIYIYKLWLSVRWYPTMLFFNSAYKEKMFRIEIDDESLLDLYISQNNKRQLIINVLKLLKINN